jgi:hypothetical protein
MNKINLPQEILSLLQRKSQEEWEYVNPNFLLAISEALDGYYEVGDEKVDQWITNMYGA